MLAGQVGKPHGLAGEVYVVRLSDDPRRFQPGAVLWHEDGRRLVVASARPHRDRFLVAFEGISSRTEAESLRGALYVETSELRPLGEDEYWEHELVGLRAVDPAGRTLGTVVRVVEGPAQDLLVLKTPRGERLVPFVAAIVTAVDLTSGSVTIDPPAGLLD